MLYLFLFPFALIYDLITRVRNFLYDKDLKHSKQFDIPVISVGNLTVGGTGKTPHIEYLIRLLRDNYKVATLSRGYGRKTQGFLIADDFSTAHTVGDEPFQYFQKYGKEILVSVGEKRSLAISNILAIRPEVQVILLDDAYQHRAVYPSLNILLTDYTRPFYKDYLLPAGRLREARIGANRASVVIVSKCPSNITELERKKIKDQIHHYTSLDALIFFTSIHYGTAIPVFSNQTIDIDWQGKRIILLTGLANASSIKQYVSANALLQEHLDYPDHYDYKEEDARRIEKVFHTYSKESVPIIITTEKDAVKLKSLKQSVLSDLPLVYLPIEVYFLEEKELFEKKIKEILKVSR